MTGRSGSPRRRHRQRLTVVRDRAGEVAEPLPHPAAVVPRPRVLRGEPDRLRVVVDRALQIADRLSDGATVVPSITAEYTVVLLRQPRSWSLTTGAPLHKRPACTFPARHDWRAQDAVS